MLPNNTSERTGKHRGPRLAGSVAGRSTRSLGCTAIGGAMKHMRTLWFAFSCGLVTFSVSPGAFAQICKPVSQRTDELGCWITANGALGQLPRQPIFWHLDTYPTRTEAEATKGPR